MALFSTAFIEQVLDSVHRQHTYLGNTLGIHAQPQPSDPISPLRSQLNVLVQVANGEIARAGASRDTERAVEAALTMLMDTLAGNALNIPATLNDAFWHTEIGVLVSRVRWWLSADDLITISNAAALAFGSNTQASRMRIARAIESGQLEWIPDPSVANPQHNRRVLRSQVERLRDQRQLPT